MAGRVQELLAEERAGAAELAHQLRTPLTVLTVDIDAVSDDEVRARLTEDALALQRTTDEIIDNARRTTREGLRATCDAVAVVADRVRFWQVLADDQRRATRLALPGEPIIVRLTETDLATLVDILLQNVFSHTPEGAGYDVALTSEAGGAARLTVADSGSGFPARPATSPSVRLRPGSTGLGLAIAGRLAQASGGRLDLANTPSGGAVVAVILGPAAA
jgi:signal transduction histidine kinase